MSLSRPASRHGSQSPRRHIPALEFVAGYAIETSLSVDNLFVFLVIFQGFRISQKRQHTALLWGVAGAVVLRGLFIAVGVTMLQRFDWISWIFGLILLYAAWRLVRGGSAHAAVPEWIRRLQPAKGSLLPVILAVEVTDILFAVDSIPAVLAVSHNPFIVYTSNIAAIMGLRSLYFALAALLDRFRYLHYGLGAMLAFVAFKMLAAPWIDVSITLSLAIMGDDSGRLRCCVMDGGRRRQGNRDRGTGVSLKAVLPLLEPDLAAARENGVLPEIRIVPLGKVIAEVSAATLCARKCRVQDRICNAAESLRLRETPASFSLAQQLLQSIGALLLRRKTFKHIEMLAQQAGIGPHRALQFCDVVFQERLLFLSRRYVSGLRRISSYKSQPIFQDRFRRPRTKYKPLEQRIGSQPVGAVHPGTCDFARSIKPAQVGAAR